MAQTEICGFKMSSLQLDELWNYDAQQANTLMGMPVRSCSATPSSYWGTEMPKLEFEALKANIRTMWLRAAITFSPYEEDDIGWGLKVNMHYKGNLSLPEGSYTEMGWIAVAPKEDDCPTAHRYLRSPIGTNSYLGGPLSLANWSSLPTVDCKTSVSSRSRNIMYLQTKKPLSVGTPIVWNYGIKLRDGTSPSFFTVSEWQLDDCCSLTETSSGSSSKEKGTAKRALKHTVSCPPKILRINVSYRFCTYCGLNLEEDVEPLKKKNMKPHWAMNHSVAIRNEMRLPYDDVDEWVIPNDFFRHLLIVGKVIDTLESHGYTVVPACQFLSNQFGDLSSVLDVDEDEQLKIFAAYEQEALSAFKRYRVVHLKGILLPRSFQDLFPVACTSYQDLIWKDHKRPRSNKFSCNFLDKDDADGVRIDIESKFQGILLQYYTM